MYGTYTRVTEIVVGLVQPPIKFDDDRLAVVPVPITLTLMQCDGCAALVLGEAMSDHTGWHLNARPY